jgi:hypothetical protein
MRLHTIDKWTVDLDRVEWVLEPRYADELWVVCLVGGYQRYFEDASSLLAAWRAFLEAE